MDVATPQWFEQVHWETVNRPRGPVFCFTRGGPSSWFFNVVVTTIFINVDVLPRTVFVSVDVATPQVIYTGSLGSRFEAVRAGF